MSGEIFGNTYGCLNVRSSSNFNAEHSVEYGLINYNKGNDTPKTASSSWCALTNDAPNQWVTLSSTEPVEFVGIRTQGRGDFDQWVTSYQVKYTLDGSNWNTGPSFNANTDRNTIITNRFDTPIIARSIAIHPLTFFGHISMRFDAIFKTFPRMQTGTVKHEGGPLASGMGERTVDYKVVFPKAFPVGVIPNVTTAVQLIDSSNLKNLRINIGQKDVTNTGFTIVFKTWFDTQLFAATGTWFAFVKPEYF
ncbi:discoidin II [Heterostelium album PN500]|uniref:Discoidin II n=1 Tax=Heterostelium pallidum (strain ATCC 26659 / Pp 5 / PN500) TaxID=670386 RepID=D3BSU0_HETP5|nr:discoidin II [Heterostelium album PN500]EFA75555.1 discoidin II [Heterostelium album PN500]|eukprot:XP_020427689.1 discoidin II [Heterostelium album PN500]